MTHLDAICPPIPVPDPALDARIHARLDTLTKPPGSLGRLEDLARQLGTMQGTERPQAARKLIVVMAADHGVAAAGVSAYPPAVTGQMVQNFLRGGAAINVLARLARADVLVVDMGVASSLPPETQSRPGFLDRRIAPGTQNFLLGPAMEESQALAALAAGSRIAQERAALGLDLIAGGDMGIANTTSSSVIVALVTGADAAHLVGRGTGVDDAALARKRAAVAEAVRLHRQWRGGIDLLRRVGGFEIAGLAGLMLGAASQRLPIVLDGFIATAAALAAVEICPTVKHYLISAHCSAEPGHRAALDHLGLAPLLDWNLRLGEGTGAALVFPLLEAACRILAEMATFADAGVADRLD